jgi:anti-anti-sigma factor
MEVRGAGYLVCYDPERATVICEGILDLRGKAGYGEIMELLEQAVAADSPLVTLDLKDLEFLNSSGITTLGGFIIKLRDREVGRLRIQCSNKYTWQSRSMRGLQKLMPTMQLDFA